MPRHHAAAAPVIHGAGTASGDSARRYEIPVNEGGAGQIIPYPAESGPAPLSLEPGNGDKAGSAGYSLEFVRQ